MLHAVIRFHIVAERVINDLPDNFSQFLKKYMRSQAFTLLLQIKPPGTFVHRCESSGCCMNYEERCQSNKTTEVAVVVTFGVLGKTVKDMNVTVSNHTACSCQTKDKPENNPPKKIKK